MLDAHKKRPAAPSLPKPWRQAIQRMDEALEHNAPPNNHEKIEMLGRQMFGHLWKIQPNPESHPD
jgi:hypothetical protein